MSSPRSRSLSSRIPRRATVRRGSIPRGRNHSPFGTAILLRRLFLQRPSLQAGRAEEDSMGLFKFIKEAGAKLFGGSAEAATPDALKKEVENHGFDANKLGIEVQGDKVKLSGQAMSQEE